MILKKGYNGTKLDDRIIKSARKWNDVAVLTLFKHQAGQLINPNAVETIR